MKSFREVTRKARLVDSPLSVRGVAQRFGLNPPISVITLLDAIDPEVLTFHGDVLTPAGTALGGGVDMTLRSNGSYTVQFHLHDSGIPDYDFMVRAIYTTPGGLTLAAQFSGHVEGTESTTLTHAPNRNSDQTENGTNPFIHSHWSDIKNGRLWITKEYSAGGVVGFVEDLAKAVLDVGVGAVGGALGIVIGLGAEIGQVFGDLGVGGAFGLVAGVVVFVAGGSLVLAVVAGVAVGAVTNALIKQRPLSAQEAEFARQVFGNSLSAPERIILTNLSGLGGRAFTMPGADRNIYINLGAAYDSPDPLHYTNGAYPSPGQVLIHELTHAWQIAHTSFLPGLVCEGIVNQANNQVGQSVYTYGPPGPVWSNFNLEQQGAIIDQWFGGTPTVVVPNRSAMDPNDPYFVYVRDNVRAGQS